jgi:hypothetical protein
VISGQNASVSPHLTRRHLLAWPPLAAAGALLGATPSPASAAGPAARTGPLTPQWTVMTPVSHAAARTDRRPVGGGGYDPVARTTFITWGGAHEDNQIQAYDHRTGTWSAPVRAGSGGDDSHNYPTFVQAADGHLLVFHSIHNTDLVVARSPQPHRIDGAWTERVIAEGRGATYPMPFMTADGSIYVFVRETVHDLDPTWPVDTRPMKYLRSTDHGLTWHNSQQLTGDRWAIAPITRPDNLNEIYIGQLRHQPARYGRPERVHIVYTLAGGGPEGHLHDRYHRSLYHTYFTPRDLHFHAADGTDLGTSVDDAKQERYLKIVDTPIALPAGTKSPDYIQLVGERAGRVPLVVWMQTDDAGVLHTYAGEWTPRGWRTAEVATGVRVRDMEPVDAFTWRVYATLEGAASGIATYLLGPGNRWRPESSIDTSGAVQRIEVIGGYRDPARILATGTSSARDVSVADGDVYVAGVACPIYP